MAFSASGNSCMILATACDCGTPGYIGVAGLLPMNRARIALRKGLATNPSLVISVGSSSDEIEIAGEMDPVEAGDSVLDNMGVLSPFLVLDSMDVAAGQRQSACKHYRCALTHRTSGGRR